MLDEIHVATHKDFDAAWQLYADICAQMPHDRFSPQWVLGVYPSQDDLRQAIDEAALRLGFAGEELVAAVIVRPCDDAEYASVPWPSGASGTQASVVHLLAVHPSARGRGVGAELVAEAIRVSREWGKRAIHLDVMPGNVVASKMYMRAGFAFVGDFDLYYEDTGTASFELYELDLGREGGGEKSSEKSGKLA